MSARSGAALAFAAALLLAACERGSADERWLDRNPAPELQALGVKSGQSFRLSDQRGKVVLLAFGYTSCLEICPTTLAKMSTVYRLLGEDASRFQAIYTSVDPQRDQPEPFRKFLSEFDDRIEGLYLEGDALTAVLRAWGVTVVKRPPEVRRYVGHTVDPERDYSMDHTASLWLVDKSGALRVRYSSHASAETITAGVRKLLHEAEG